VNVSRYARFTSGVIIVGLVGGYFALLGVAVQEHSTQSKVVTEQRNLEAETSQLASAQAHICGLERAQYNGQLTYTRFLAHEFHATPKQTKRAIADLKVVIGHKPPSCQ
jgi:hypothetical protein